jgi:DNA-binding NarL/FixJ family response regulator
MQISSGGSALHQRTYVIEPQRFFLPYLETLLTQAGCAVVAMRPTIDERDLHGHDPALVFFDVDFSENELCSIRSIRAIVPTARIIVYATKADELFRASCYIAGANAAISKADDDQSVIQIVSETAWGSSRAS